MSHSANQKEKPCTIYIDLDEQNQPTAQEIQKTLETGKLEEKIKALKSLIIQLIHDDSFPRMTMTIINFVLAAQTDNHNLKKVLLYYWEIVDKMNANGTVKDEMILVCNSLRNDLLHPNEFIRGRTLRLLSKLMFKPILEPLAPSILENLKHKNSYVRRNAVSCLYIIYLNFQNEVISDIDEYIEELLKNESDLSTKRNAFMLLFNSNQAKGLEFITKYVIGDNAEDMGDIMQLAVLELLRKTSKFDPTQKSKLMKAIFSFSNSKSSSVLFECANTLTQISNAPTAIKVAINIYIQLLCGNSDNNVKLIVLDKLQNIMNINPKLLEEQLIDITKVLSNHDSDIRQKTLDLLKSLLRSKNVLTFFPLLKKELKSIANSTEAIDTEYRNLLLNHLVYCVQNFAEVAEDTVEFLIENYLSQSNLDDTSTRLIASIIQDVIDRHSILQQTVVKSCVQRFGDIQSIQILKVILWSIGEYLENHESVLEALDIIKKQIGILPFELEKKSSEGTGTVEKPQVRTRTIILADGSYGTEVISTLEAKKTLSQDEGKSFLRENILTSSFFASSVVVTLLKLLYRIRTDTEIYNPYASQVLMILIGLLKFYNMDEAKTDPELINKLTIGIKFLTNPKIFISKNFSWLEKEGHNETIANKKKALVINKLAKLDVLQAQDIHMAKQPDDLIVIRQLKGKTSFNDIDLADEEVNEVLIQGSHDNENEEFTTKLKKIVQLTGYSDPIYAEAIVDIHKYDINFEIFLINRTNKTLQNITVEFSTQGDLRIVDKPPQVTLGANQATSIKTGLKLVSSEAGLIFASINFENTAGISQGYLITNEIQIDMIEFIYPGEIRIEEFRTLWSKYEWENKVIVNTHFEDPLEFVRSIAKELKMYILDDLSKMEENAFISVNLYAKTKLDDDFLMNVSLEKAQNKIVGFIRLRGKSKAIIVLLGEKLKQIQARRQ